MTPEEYKAELDIYQAKIDKRNYIRKLRDSHEFDTILGEDVLNNLIVREIKRYTMNNSTQALELAKVYAGILVYFDEIIRDGNLAELSLHDLKDSNFE